MATERSQLIIDVDTGIDDAFALLYACASPNAQLVGVSTVAGNVDLARATRNTCAVLALGRRADIPVWPGCVEPMLHAPRDARAVHGVSGLGYAELPEPQAARATHAIDAIVAHAQARPGELTLVATGPLTNVAGALMREPALPRLLQRLVLMGGAYRRAPATSRRRPSSTSGTIRRRRGRCFARSPPRTQRRWSQWGSM